MSPCLHFVPKMKLLPFRKCIIDQFKNKFEVLKNRPFFHTSRILFSSIWEMFLRKTSFSTSKYYIFNSNSRINLIFDSDEFWGQIFFKLEIWKRGGKRGGIRHDKLWRRQECEKNHHFEHFLSMDAFLKPHVPPLFKKFWIIKYVALPSFCTKNEVPSIQRAHYRSI